MRRAHDSFRTRELRLSAAACAVVTAILCAWCSGARAAHTTEKTMVGDEAVPGKTSSRVLFPDSQLFLPLLANPKEPRSHMTWQSLHLDQASFNVGSVGFGDTFGLARWVSQSSRHSWQIGIGGAVLAQFNLDSESLDLINADYIVGIPLTYRSGGWSARLRLFHQSSHLGDEFLLFPQQVGPVERINLSYETLELLCAQNSKWFRMYGGGSYIVHTDTPLGRKGVHGGLEYYGPPIGKTSLRFVAASDFRSWEETGWGLDASVKLGLDIESPYSSARSLQLLLEYFHGNLPYGQFFDLDAHYFGLGVTFTFGRREFSGGASRSGTNTTLESRPREEGSY